MPTLSTEALLNRIFNCTSSGLHLMSCKFTFFEEGTLRLTRDLLFSNTVNLDWVMNSLLFTRPTNAYKIRRTE